MKSYTLKVEKRENMGTSASRKLRNQGFITGEVYGSHDKNTHIKILRQTFERFLRETRGEAVIVDLELEKKKIKCIPKEITRDVVYGHPIHVDFQMLHPKELIHSVVPVILMGTPAGVKVGGILEHLKREVHIKAIPLKLPGHIEVDVSNLHIGHSLHVEDIKIEDVEILDDPKETVCTVLAPRKVVEEVPVEVAPEEEIPSEEGPAPPAEESEEEK